MRISINRHVHYCIVLAAFEILNNFAPLSHLFQCIAMQSRDWAVVPSQPGSFATLKQLQFKAPLFFTPSLVPAPVLGTLGIAERRGLRLGRQFDRVGQAAREHHVYTTSQKVCDRVGQAARGHHMYTTSQKVQQYFIRSWLSSAVSLSAPLFT